MAAVKEQLQKVPVSRPNGGEFLKQLFTVDKDLRKYYDCEELEPEDVPRSQRYQMLGAKYLSSIYGLANDYDSNERNFRSECAQLASMHLEKDVPLKEMKKVLQAILATFEAKGAKCNEAQKKVWTEMFEKMMVLFKENGMH